MNDPPTFLSLFAGIGGFDLALNRSGFWCVGQVEIDPFCARVLAARFPHAPRWADVRQWQGDGHESPDLLVGGFPCQGASVAGKRLGLADDRTALFWEICRIQKIVQARWALLENVPGLRSVRFGRDFAVCLAALKELWPVVGWRTLDSRFFHVAQRRERVFFVCDPSEAAVASVLFESEGGGGHPAAGEETGETIAGTLGVGSSSTRLNFDGHYVTGTLPATSGEKGSRKHGHGFGQQERESGFLIAATLNSGGNQGGFRTEPGEHLTIQDVRTMDKAQHGLGISGEGVAYTLDGTGAQGIAQNQRGEVLETDYAHQLTAGGGKPGEGYPAVRRLTPMECERLQAFPDGWTCLCRPIEAYTADPEAAAWNCRCPDGSRYRALGNAVTVSAVEWVARRLSALAAREEGTA